MSTEHNKADRDHRNGQYTHTLDRVCRCGATKGQHMAVAPYDLEDTKCLGFKLAKAKK